MRILKKIIGFFQLSTADKEIFHNQIYLDNLRRVLYFCLVSIPVSAIHFIIFGFKHEGFVGAEHQWSTLIFISHSVIVFVSSVAIILIYFFSYRHRKINLIGTICVNVLILLLLTAGAFIASADQLITPAITPYLVTCLIISLVILIPPFHSVLYFTVSYLVFYYAISLTQTNPDILISNQVNGLTITAIGLSLSIILWKSNITRIRQSKLIEKQNMELTESGLSKDKFFSIIAHDLKGPFSGIIGFSKLLQEDLELKNYQKINKHVSLIKSSAENTYKLLENLLEWSMSETGKISFNPEKISFSEIMKDKINEFSILAKAKNISVSYVHESDINVYADRNMLNTILRNLISNAIKYTLPDGKIEIKTSVVPGFAEIIISDNGIGLTDKIKDHLFKLGSNVSRKGTAKEKGTGLGLILSKEFVEKLGGKIWAENNVGGGSQFIFTLPVSVP